MWNDWDDDFDDLWGILNEDFDDFDLAEEPDFVEHYTYVEGLAHSWNWPNGRGRIVDLRKIPIQYVLALAAWMEKRHATDAPYMESRQYRLLQRRIKKDQAWIDLAKRVLQGPKYTWQRLKTSH